MYACMHIHIHTYCIYIYIHKWQYMYVYWNKCIRALSFAHMHIHVFTYILNIHMQIYINIYIYIFIYIILMDLVISKQYLKVICWINELIQDEKNCRTPGDPTNFSFVPESSYSQDGQCTWQGSLPSKLLKIVSEGDSDLYQLGVLGGVMALMGLNVTTWYSMEVS